MRMRDLAGLIVIDFIDMDERKNNISVEKKLRDSLKFDRARIQIGKISAFGLLEMSRQRLRYGMIEATTMLCENCHGTGLTRSNENLSLSILRKLENLELDKNIKEINVKVPINVANYILNQKRKYLEEIEKEIKTTIFINSDLSIINPDYIIEMKKISNNNEEDSSLSNVITMDGGKINNLADGLNKSSSMENNSIINNETSKDSNFKKPKRRRRKNTKFRKFDNNTEENHPYNNFEDQRNFLLMKKSEDENNKIEERDAKQLNKIEISKGFIRKIGQFQNKKVLNQ